MRWPAYLRGVLAFSAVERALPVPAPAAAGPSAAVARLRADHPGPGVQHGGVLRRPTPTGSRTPASRPWATSSRPAGLAVQNFVSAAVGIAVAVALVRGFARSRTGELGNFWADLVRGTVRILLPLSVVGGDRAGRVRRHPELRRHPRRSPVHGRHAGHQTGGAVASQEAIKELGTNGGGFFNANSAHPFENPNALHQPASRSSCSW